MYFSNLLTRLEVWLGDWWWDDCSSEKYSVTVPGSQCNVPTPLVLKTLTTLPIRKSARPVTRGGRQVFTSRLSSNNTVQCYRYQASPAVPQHQIWWCYVPPPPPPTNPRPPCDLATIIYSSLLANSQPAWHLRRSPNVKSYQNYKTLFHSLLTSWDLWKLS